MDDWNAAADASLEQDVDAHLIGQAQDLLAVVGNDFFVGGHDLFAVAQSLGNQ